MKLLVALHCFYAAPAVLWGALALFGYLFVPTRPMVIAAALLALLLVLLTALLRRNRQLTRKEEVLLSLLPCTTLLFVAGSVFYFICYQAAFVGVLLSAAAIAATAVILWNKKSKTHLSYVLGGLCLAALLPMTLFAVSLFMAYSDPAPEVTLQSQLSPDGTHLAQVILLDQKTVYADTTVLVRENREDIDLWAGRLRYYPAQEVYRINRNRELTVAWKDDETLVVNGKDYKVK